MWAKRHATLCLFFSWHWSCAARKSTTRSSPLSMHAHSMRLVEMPRVILISPLFHCVELILRVLIRVGPRSRSRCCKFCCSRWLIYGRLLSNAVDPVLSWPVCLQIIKLEESLLLRLHYFVGWQYVDLPPASRFFWGVGGWGDPPVVAAAFK